MKRQIFFSWYDVFIGSIERKTWILGVHRPKKNGSKPHGYSTPLVLWLPRRSHNVIQAQSAMNNHTPSWGLTEEIVEHGHTKNAAFQVELSLPFCKSLPFFFVLAISCLWSSVQGLFQWSLLQGSPPQQEAKAQPPISDGNFIPASGFSGYVPGFFFQMGSKVCARLFPCVSGVQLNSVVASARMGRIEWLL